MTHTARTTDRGTTLIEAMVALTILLIGIVGMMQLQVLGITSNAGARSYSQALQVAHELASALEQLDASDTTLLGAHYTGSGPAAPAGFGSVLSGPNTLRSSSAFTTFTDSTVLRGAASNATILATYGKDVAENLPRYQRRWQVWQVDTASTAVGVKAIAVSVTYREPKLPGLREVVLLTQVSNRGLASAFASAYR